MKYFLVNTQTKLTERTFQNMEELINFLAQYNENKTDKNAYGDWLQSNFCSSSNFNMYVEKYLTMEYNNFFTSNSSLFLSFYNQRKQTELNRYLIIIDEKKKIFNYYSYQTEILSKKYIKPKRKFKQTYVFRKDPVPYNGRFSYKKYYRKVGYKNILNSFSIPEYSEFFRKKRKNTFEDFYFIEQKREYSKSWKDCTKKRKQWM